MGEHTVDDGIMILDDASVVLIEEPAEATPWSLDDADTRVWIRPYAARYSASRPGADAGAWPRLPPRPLPRPHRGHSSSRSL
ncbi:hypothetical protein [Paraliomyxa miuraensis]|uniref:hypothetical protein n=1 Tax=Paraliomyxa miuraensis TaxID=376150 RepID=UPI00224EC9A8|nr:hypothetical protein [Paraliomyxa miuraensis]MCX4244529.1 hypothetical protein [Paraliomyxa miuraensis]